MSRWAFRLLVVAMAAWTLLTGMAGWYAVRGHGQPASADDGVAVVYDVAAPDRPRDVRRLDRTAAAEVLDAIPRAPEPAPTRPASRQAVPKYAQSAGADRRIRPITSDAKAKEPARKHGSRGVVVLDPGHGRGDPGAVHYFDDGSGRYYTEAESNLRNAELIRTELQALGYEVYLTREGAGQGPGAPLPLQFITSDLFARVALAKAVDADVYLAIHGNGASVRSISGPETWYCGKHEEGAANEQLASMVQQAMMDALREYGYNPPDRGIKEDAQSHHSGDFCQFVVTRETPVPAALLEFLFLSNPDDARVLVDDRAHVLMAQHVARAIDTFMQHRPAN